MQPRKLKQLSEEERLLLTDRRRDLLEAVPYVEPIIEMVRKAGDRALAHFTLKFDGLEPRSLTVPKSQLRAAWTELKPSVKRALQAAKENLEMFHKQQVPREILLPIGGKETNGSLGLRPIPLRRVGLYAPGGPRGYPSSVLMAGVPAKLAGVDEVVLCTPPGKDGWPALASLAAAHLCDIDEVYAVGGAQAVAALALGTESIRKVEKIVGPGSNYVTAAKYLLRDDVAIDSLAGPSEVVVVADDSADPTAVAWDLAAQAEHGPDSFVLLLTPSLDLAARVSSELSRILTGETEGRLARPSLERQETILTTDGLEEALAFASELRPEHLVLHLENPRGHLDAVRGAAAVFLGQATPVSFGDYCLGTNHILPTMGMARTSSPLTVLDFIRWQSWAEATIEGMEALSDPTSELAKLEGFSAHAKAVSVRRRRKSDV